MINLIAAFSYSFAVSVSDKIFALILAGVLPLFFMKKKSLQLSLLYKINLVNLIMIVTLALTWPEFLEGLKMGILIALRVNMIYVVFAAIISPMGVSGVYEALESLRAPEKFRVLMLLTLRGIFILRERFDSALISVRLRAPNLRGVAKFKIFAYVTANALLQGSERSERMLRAITCRGGFGGFNQFERKKLKSNDIIFLAGFIFYSISIIILNYGYS